MDVTTDTAGESVGFRLQATVSGHKRAIVEPGLNPATLLHSLAKLAADSDVVEINLENFCPDGIETKGENAIHKQLAKCLLPFVFNDNIIKIVLPKKWLHCVSGVCEGLITESVRKVTGPKVSILDVDVNIRDLLVSDRKLCKLVCPVDNSADRIAVTADVLKEVRTMTEVPYVLVSRIYSAHKHIRTLRNKSRKVETIPHQESEDNSTTSDYSSEDDVPNSVRNSLGKDRFCYACKKKFSFPDKVKTVDIAWMQYPAMCYTCAVYNYRKRFQSTNLRGKYAVVTGGRIKIGYHVVLKLLRDGCHVITTTRFPRDAARRFQEEADFDQFQARLKIFPLDFRKIQDAYNFIKYVDRTFPYLDILVNNAAQTIRRPVQFYQHLLDTEKTPYHILSETTRSLLAGDRLLDNTPEVGTPHTDMVQCCTTEPSLGTITSTKRTAPPGFCTMSKKRLKGKPGSLIKDNDKDCDHTAAKTSPGTTDGQHHNVPSTSHQSLVHDRTTDHQTLNTSSLTMSDFFPAGQMDSDGQQLDLRPQNSWRMGLAEVPLVELVEVLAVNSVGPFLLTQQLKPALDRSPAKRRFVVNVSAMEGQFNRASKNHFHPHTNMAKAAVNMLTRTSGVEFRETGVYMTAVDTGWVTDERPYPQMQHEQRKGFFLPLDSVDGAARIYDPVVSGYENTEKEPFYAVFLKDYHPFPW